MKALWMRAGIGSVALATMLGALAVIASSAPASTWKVVDGHVSQRVDWITSSSADNGCYTHTFGDTGTATISYRAVKGATVKLQKPGTGNYGLTPTGGIPFSGTDRQTAEYRLHSQRDENAPRSCGKDTQKPPDTSGCKTVQGRSKMNLYWDPARGVFLDGIVSKPKWFNYRCPSDDAYSVITVNANSGANANQFERQDRVHLAGSATDPTKTYLTYPAYNDHHGSQQATINWALTLKRVRNHHHGRQRHHRRRHHH